MATQDTVFHEVGLQTHYIITFGFRNDAFSKKYLTNFPATNPFENCKYVNLTLLSLSQGLHLNHPATIDVCNKNEPTNATS